MSYDPAIRYVRTQNYQVSFEYNGFNMPPKTLIIDEFIAVISSAYGVSEKNMADEVIKHIQDRK